SFEELGGARTHASRSGVAHFTAADDRALIEDCRYLLSFLPQSNEQPPAWEPPSDPAEREDAELDTLIPDESTKPYDMHEVIRRHGAKLLYAYCEATVPKLTVITRKAYGGAYDVMGSKHVGADFNFAWPTAEVAVMGSDGAVNIVFRKELEAADDAESRREELVEEYRERFANPFTAAERGYVDDVIAPRHTRPALIAALQASRSKQV